MTPAPSESTHARVQRLRAAVNALHTVTEPEARKVSAAPVTKTYTIRMIAQCEMLLTAIASEPTETLVLVRTENGIAIWRKLQTK